MQFRCTGFAGTSLGDETEHMGMSMLVKSWNFTDKYAADVVCLRKPSRKGTRQTKQLESSLNDERGVETFMHDTGLLVESSTLETEDCSADIVRLRESSRKSLRHTPKLESSLHD